MEDLLKLAKKGRLEDLEGAWMAAIEGVELPWQGMLEAAAAVVHRKAGPLAESLLYYLVCALRDRGDLQGAFSAAAAACRILPKSTVLRDEAAEVFVTLHEHAPAAEAMARVALKETETPLDVAIQQLEHLQQLVPGTYVREDPGARFGRVEAFDAESGRLVVAFAEGPARYDPAAASRLQVVQRDDFRALLVCERGRLETLAREIPEELVALVLRTFGPRMELVRLKRQVEFVTGADAWSKWWSRARQALEHSSTIGLTDGKKPDLFLRSTPVGPADLLKAQFDAAGPLDKLALVLKALDQSPGPPDERAALLAHFAREVAGLTGRSSGSSPGLTLGAMAVLEAIRRRAPDVEVPPRPVPDGWINGIDIAEATRSVLNAGPVLLAVLDALPAWAPQSWHEVYAQLMPRLPKDACQRAARTMAEAGQWDRISQAARGLLEGRDPQPGALLWLWDASGSASMRRALGDISRSVVMRQLLAAAASVGRAHAGPADERRASLTLIRQAFLGNDGVTVKEALELATDADVMGLLGLVERNPGFSPQAREELGKVIRACRPALFSTYTPPWEENVVYTTPAGLEKCRQELQRVVHERLPEVIREIGEAAGFGDLSDNAEYRAALEERGRLAKQSVMIQEQLARARVITHEMASAPHVTVGSRVRARNLQSGAMETFAFLGPWDADPPSGICSYRAPLGKAFMGHVVGETVEFASGDVVRRWEILEIGPAV